MAVFVQERVCLPFRHRPRPTEDGARSRRMDDASLSASPSKFFG